MLTRVCVKDVFVDPYQDGHYGSDKTVPLPTLNVEVFN